MGVPPPMHPRRLRRAAAAVLVALLAAGVPGGAGAQEGRTLRVPVDFATVQAAVDASTPGDTILLAPGTYPGEVEVHEGKGGITIRGEDRNTVVFDGGRTRANAIDVEADGVTLENMSAHSFVENGFYWDGVERYAGRYLTVWNVGLYGIYAISSRDGVIEDSFVSGAADAAFYIGECNPCDATVRRVTAILSAVGYSGTNAGGNLVVEDSTWDRNSVGILPNSFEVGLEPPPQRSAIFRKNVVTATGTVPTPRQTPLGGFHGIGIGVLGGNDNTIDDNDVTGSTRYGIAVFTAIDFSTQWVPSSNRVTGNTVAGSGLADLALAAGAGAGNCFEGNTAAVVVPATIAGACSEAGGGDPAVADEIVLPPPEMLAGLPPAPDYFTMPAAPAQPTMPVDGGSGGPGGPNRERPPIPVGILLLLVVGMGLSVLAIALGTRIRQTKSGQGGGTRLVLLGAVFLVFEVAILLIVLIAAVAGDGPRPTPSPAPPGASPVA